MKREEQLLPLLEIRLFGAPQIHLNGTPVNGLPVKPQALLFYLAITRQTHLRSTLATLLWGDMPEQRARANLRKAIQQLRSTLPDHLNIEQQSITLRAGAETWIDVVAFEQGINQAASAGDAQSIEAAVALYRGDFLAGFFVRNAPDFEAWQLAQQAHLRERMLGGLQMLSQHWIAQNEVERALATTRRMIELEPWREEAHRQLMALLAQSGDRGAALTQYDQCAAILADELDVEPSAATLALVTNIRNGEYDRSYVPSSHSALLSTEKHATTSSKHNLPMSPTPLIGRKPELAELACLIENPDIRLITILGLGGIGKTRLALAAASNHMSQFNDGVYWVALAPLTEPENIAIAIGEALGLLFEDQQQLQQQLCHHLHTKQILLLLDNFEHLTEGSNLLADILRVAPTVTILVTSRVRLNLQGEWLFEVEGLETPIGEAIQGKRKEQQYSSITLFLERVHQIRPMYTATEADMVEIIHICQLMQGVPLAIELAAALTRVLPCSDIAKEIVRGLHVLDSTQRDIPDRHRSLHAVFEHSWHLLSNIEQSIFARLSIFRNHFTREAALQITDASLPFLSAFIDKSLMQLNSTGEYEIHELVRQFAAEKLYESGEFEATRTRHEAYFVALSEKELHRLRGRIYHPNYFDDNTFGSQIEQVNRPRESLHLQQATRILMISPESPKHVLGGLGRHVTELVQALSRITLESGPLLIDLVVPCFEHKGSVESINPAITIFQVSIPTVADTTYGGVLASNALLVAQANTLIEQHSYDLIHIHDISVCEAGLALRKQWNLPMLTTIHQTVRGRYQRQPPSEINQVEQLERQMGNESEQIIVTSQFMKQEIHSRLDIPHDKISVIANGIEIAVEKNRSSDELATLHRKFAPAGQKLLFFIGHTTYEKGLLTLIRAMPNILASHPDTILLVASKHGAKLRPLVYELNVEEAVVFLGYVSDYQRDSFYQIVDAVIIPSLYEPFGIVALEAMALSCNVIASNVGGLAEVVTHMQTGLLVTPNDPDSIAEAVNHLFADPTAAQQWRYNAHKEIDTLYRWDNIATQTAKVYELIASAHRKPIKA